MKRLLQYSLLVGSLVLAVQLLAPPWAQAQSTLSERLPLTVCLINDAGLTDDLVAKVQARVDALFTTSGITIRWIRGGDPGRTVEERWACAHPEALQRVVIRWMKGGLLKSPNELGEAFVDASGKGVIADLFLDKVERIRAEREIDLTLLLAHLTAHELGHLLLGGEPHSVLGLMQAKVSEDSLTKMMQGNCTFSRVEQKKMHARVKRAELSAMLARNRAESFGK